VALSLLMAEKTYDEDRHMFDQQLLMFIHQLTLATKHSFGNWICFCRQVKGGEIPTERFG
jgi:ferredoxin-thioredoxin reductase catalytic subunit